MNELCERPYYAHPYEVRAFLTGRKTQLRLPVTRSNIAFGSADKRFFEHCDFDAPSCFADNGYLHVPCHCQGGDGFEITREVDCEFCKDFGWEGTRHRLYSKMDVGDRLWIKEKWCVVADCAMQYPAMSYLDPRGIRNFRQFESQWRFEDSYDTFACWDDELREAFKKCGTGWRPSTQMPRWASRLILEITELRVERLRQITEDDAMAEGVSLGENPDYDPEDTADDLEFSYVAGFMAAWDARYGRGSWEKNGWVWVLGVRVV